MKRLKISQVLVLITLTGGLVLGGCCSKKSGAQKNQSDIPWGNQGKTGTGGLPGGMNEKR